MTLKIYNLFFFILSIVRPAVAQNSSIDYELSGRKIDFDYSWKFFRGDASGAQMVDFNDRSWRTLDVPHDWSIEDLPDQAEGERVGPFSKQSAGGSSTGHTVGGTGWYRKHFTIPKDAAGRIIKIHFDGVYMDSDVWINGHLLGNHPYGYTPFYYDLTAHLNPPGEANVIAVRVQNLGKNSRWYTGSGIYRHVWLTLTNEIYVDPYGIFVNTPDVAKSEARVEVNIRIRSEKRVAAAGDVSITIEDQGGKVVARKKFKKQFDKNSFSQLKHSLIISSPNLWSPDSPYLYRAVVEISSGGKAIEKNSTNFGVRSLKFTSSQGFLLNGEHLSIRGACLHHDNGPLGSKAIDRAEERKVELMKANGFNAIRSSHNPPSEVLLDACDRLGVMVIDEIFDMWQLPKNPDDYHRFFDLWWKHDLESMILRDRNHPSVILWSIGNEIKERADSSGLKITKQLVDAVKALDTSRPVTAAICKFWEQPGKKWIDSEPAFALLDVGGYNYEWRNYEPDHEKHPHRIMLGTESIAMEAFQNWTQVEKQPYVIGDFVWTGMDYLGESGIGHAVLDNEKDSPLMEWPWFNGYCGDLDLCGFKKSQSYFRDVLWGRRNISMAVHVPIPRGRKEKVSFWGWPNEFQSWTWSVGESEPLEVSVFTNSDTVRLELNGDVIETRALPDTARLKTKFFVPYRTGTLKAFAVVNGSDMDSVSLKAAGAVHAIRLTADRASIKASKNDLAYVTVEFVDSAGEVVPNDDRKIEFIVEGEGTIAGVANGNPSELKSFQQSVCKTFRGRCLVIVQPNETSGRIILQAKSRSVRSASIIISSGK
jgi:beta-galactosidase